MSIGTQRIEYRPINNFLRILRCTRDEREEFEGRLYFMRDGMAVPEYVGDASNQAVILDAGPKCKKITREEVLEAVGAKKPLRVFIKENCTELHRVQGEEFLIREDNEGLINVTIQE